MTHSRARGSQAPSAGRPRGKGTGREQVASRGNGKVRELRAPVTTGVHDGEGPFYDLAGAARWLNSEPPWVEKLAGEWEVLMVTSADGRKLLPVWQFKGHAVHPDVLQVLRIFHEARLDPWAVVVWATAPDPHLGTSAIQALHDGTQVQAVLADARRYARRWSS